MLTPLLDLLSSTGAGAALGVFGAWLTKREERLDKKLETEKALALARIHKEEALLEMEQALRLADKELSRTLTEGDLAAEAKAMEAFKASLGSLSTSTGLVLVDSLRGLMRPLITLYLLCLASLVSFRLMTLTGGLEGLGKSGLTEAFAQILDQLLFLTTTAVTWWFGARPSSKRRL